MLLKRVELGRVLAIGAMLVSTGCSNVFGHDGGRVRFVLTRDAGTGGGPVANLVSDPGAVMKDDDDEEHNSFFRFQAATVTLSSVLARTLDGELVAVDVELPVKVDVVKVDGGKQFVLPDGFLPVDTYDQVVVNITAVEGILSDGTAVTIQPPGGGWTAIIPICPLEVTDGATAVVGLGLNVRSSFLQVGNWWSFHPRFRSMESCEAT